MKHQFECIAYSAKVKKYIENQSWNTFINHGYKEFSKQYSHKVILKQKDVFEHYNGEMLWVSTELGQPFLFEDNGMIDFGGILEYDNATQMGTLEINTQTGSLRIENVHTYHVFFNIQGKYLPFYSEYIPNASEIKDVCVSAIIKTNGTYVLKIFQNTECINVVENVFEEEYIFYGEKTEYKNRLSYVRYAIPSEENVYRNYIYDINNRSIITLDSSIEIPSWFIDYNKNRTLSFDKSIGSKFKNELIVEKSISIIMHLDSSKTAQIMSEIVKSADKYEIIDNLFEDDTTINIRITYNNKPEKVRLLLYCSLLNPELFGYGLYKFPIEKYEIGTLNSEYEYKHALQISENELQYFKMMNRELFDKCNEQIKINQLPEKIYNNLIASSKMISLMYEYLSMYDNVQKQYIIPKQGFITSGKSRIFELEKKQYNEIFSDLAKEGKLLTKWKNEYELFLLLKSKYNDAIYQYHSPWLNRQSLDIFVPSINTGFEYQGKQHYVAVEYFGGKEQLKKQKERDLMKKKLCKQNGIRLIEWRYDEPVTKRMLEVKLKMI